MAAYKLAIKYGKDNKFFIDNYYPIPYLGLGLIFENEQSEKALAFFNKAINMASNFYIDTKNIYYEEEINNYNDGLAKAYLYKAYLLEKLKQFDEAAINYGEATIYNKYMYSAYFGKAACLGKLGKAEEAIMIYDKLLTLNPHHSQDEHCIYAYYKKAHLFNTLQKYEEEINALDKFINYKNKYEKNGERFINISFEESYLAKATALSKLNKNQESDYCKGLAAYFAGKNEKAVDFFDQALEQNSKNSNSDIIAACYFYKGCSLIRLNEQIKENNLKAIECFNKAYENVNYLRVKVFLFGFVKINKEVIEEKHSHDLIVDRDNLIKKFISNIMLDVTSSDSKIIGNLNTLICETISIIKQTDIITEQNNDIISGEVSEKIHDSDSL